MKKSHKLIITGVCLLLAFLIIVFSLISLRDTEKVNGSVPDSTQSNVSVSVPDEPMQLTDTLPDIKEPEESYDTSINTSNENIPVVESATIEKITDKIFDAVESVPRDDIETEIKETNIIQTGPSAGEDRNDVIIKDKENATTAYQEVPKEVTLESEVVSVDGNKDEVFELNEETITEGDGKNTPQYIPSTGGDNPFDDNTKTEINDTPVDNYIGEGEDRPGDGIHF